MHEKNRSKKYDDKKKDKSSLNCRRCDRSGHLAEKCFSTAKEDGTKLDPKTAALKPPKKKNVNVVEKQSSSNKSQAITTAVTSATQNPLSKPDLIVEIRRVCSINTIKENLIK